MFTAKLMNATAGCRQRLKKILTMFAAGFINMPAGCFAKNCADIYTVFAQ
jgi:hypothetical protein